MNRRATLKLYKNAALSRYIAAQARRHFSCAEDQEDAIAEVWEKLAEERAAPADPRHFAYRVIKNVYDRMLYQRRNPNTNPNTTPKKPERIG